jgi:hypothetical protein
MGAASGRLGALVALLALCAGCTGPRVVTPRAGSTPPRAGSSAPAPAAPPAAQSWRIPPGHDHGIEGFADRTSVLAGQRLHLYVSTGAAHFTVQAFRMGWYGGALGRLTWTSAPTPGRQQPKAVVVVTATHTVAARWSPSLTIDTHGWSPGDYLLRLDAAGGGARYVPLTVRGPSARGRLVLVSPVTTWQAYNAWGCCSLYNGGDGKWADRSRAVSFDRPYAGGSGAAGFLLGELPVVAEAERLRLPLDYVTDIDLHAVPHLLDGARAVVSMDHDEYWSPAMREAVTAARDSGTNLAFLGANAIYRRIRLAATPLGPDRLQINYKDAYEDPLYGHDDAQVTANWPEPPDADPESAVIGAQYGCRLHGPHVPGVVVDPTNWLFAGTRVHAGEQLPGLEGREVDAVRLSYPTPRPIEVLLHSATHFCPADVPAFADTTYYSWASGAGVFDAGSTGWICAMDSSCGDAGSATTAAVLRRVTDNLLVAFAQGPAGRAHPARDNLLLLGIH